ncbi:putative L-serine dehydratase, alpha chain [Paenibacillus larvae subsp. larvae]|uniref:L-serine dehydratase n=1 Tax=Paenibacillus larvae subsp. larvae TaxID=147375 RepID=A0A2L1TXW5_9BACL|nr:L-serine ammonia-lyase, iron-sulfur-dependent, subunit alpha [Paenibacillus larvae]AQT86052.1 L-serine ammonia-lyase, iron-sulfur-dependent, subunit alpha [Paenibacillus larvae subsp. pulvifaciens]AQZ45706.1 L-serine ammonia-lyase, iron-sulfur-dependent, subunit alpha [Paenibacillus larvae subsp. pulvifaciens]AVF25521.1 putative L-serine dehydratase, alpha chain [Paenibacillus larvae subsp. larvae]AVF30298.1 putative L-serine dehydratase, alpha chain [Paenibacillus larvae subsp. larvae]MBH0
MFHNVADLIKLTEERQVKISRIMLEREVSLREKTSDEILQLMDTNLTVMEKAIEKGLKGVVSLSGLTGGDAVLLQRYIASGNSLAGPLILDGMSKAIATNEVNAAMGIICANPTAGAAGVVPGALFAVKEKLKPTRMQMLEFLLTAGAFGFVIANNAFVSGAAGGCQAEVGSATGMAAAAIVEMAGGTPQQSAEAMSIALKNMLGLVCDPVAGLVEVPCVKRNGIGTATAIVAADMALAGIKSRIPSDEVIKAMYEVGLSMPKSLRETADGGLAATPTGRKLEAMVLGNIE